MMKKICLLIFLLKMSFFLSAQDGVGENFRKVQGKYHTYWVSDCPQAHGDIYLRYVDVNDSVRLIPYEFPDWAPKPEFSDWYKIEKIIKENLKSELKKNNILPSDNKYEEAFVVPIADQRGKVCELILTVPERWHISVSVIEKCMIAVKEGNFYMHYNLKHPLLKNEKVLKYAYPLWMFYTSIMEEE